MAWIIEAKAVVMEKFPFVDILWFRLGCFLLSCSPNFVHCLLTHSLPYARGSFAMKGGQSVMSATTTSMTTTATTITFPRSPTYFNSTVVEYVRRDWTSRLDHWTSRLDQSTRSSI